MNIGKMSAFSILRSSRCRWDTPENEGISFKMAEGVGFEPTNPRRVSGFQVRFPLSRHVPPYLATCPLVCTAGGHLYLWCRPVPPGTAKYVGNLVGNFCSWLSYGHGRYLPEPLGGEPGGAS